MAATALAEKYQALGFRVIEGGKSGKLVVLNTPAVGEIFGMGHREVLRAVRQQQEKIGALGHRSFAEHCTPTQYIDKQNRRQDCFNLTKLGFLHVAAKWDDPLRWLLVLGFDVLERGTESDQLISQINARIRELRSGASAQNELILEPPQLEPHDANQRHLEAICGTGHSVLYDNDAKQEEAEDAALAARMRATVADALKNVEPGRLVPITPRARNTDQDELWTERENDTECIVRRGRNEDGYIDLFDYLLTPRVPCSTDGFGTWLPYVNGRYVEVRLSHAVPFAIVERTYLNQMPDGPNKESASRILREYLAR